MNLEILFSYKITNILAQVASFFRFCSSFNSARYLENERYKANTKIVMNNTTLKGSLEMSCIITLPN